MLPQTNARLSVASRRTSEDYDADGADLSTSWAGEVDAYFKTEARMVPSPQGGSLDRLTVDTLVIDWTSAVPAPGEWVAFTYEGVVQTRRVESVAPRPVLPGTGRTVKLYLVSV